MSMESCILQQSRRGMATGDVTAALISAPLMLSERLDDAIAVSQVGYESPLQSSPDRR